jgi:low affinity Fe/Cu permease
MFERIFTQFANAVARWTGRPAVFLAGCLAVVVWAALGPMFHFSNTWQLLINTSTTIVTFLMVLLIQNTQNRDNAAIQAKLDELIRATQSRNHFIGIERQTDTVIEKVREEVEQHAEELKEDLLEAKEDVKKAASKPQKMGQKTAPTKALAKTKKKTDA